MYGHMDLQESIPFDKQEENSCFHVNFHPVALVVIHRCRYAWRLVWPFFLFFPLKITANGNEATLLGTSDGMLCFMCSVLCARRSTATDACTWQGSAGTGCTSARRGARCRCRQLRVHGGLNRGDGTQLRADIHRFARRTRHHRRKRGLPLRRAQVRPPSWPSWRSVVSWWPTTATTAPCSVTRRCAVSAALLGPQARPPCVLRGGLHQIYETIHKHTWRLFVKDMQGTDQTWKRTRIKESLMFSVASCSDKSHRNRRYGAG